MYAYSMAKSVVDIVFSCKSFHFLPLLAKGSALYFAALYHQAGCPDIDISQVRGLVGMRQPDWQRHRTLLSPVILEIMPGIKDKWLREKDGKRRMREALERGRTICQAKKLAMKNLSNAKNATLTEKIDAPMQILPIKNSFVRNNTGNFDDVARRKAIEKNKAATEGWMTDD